MSVYACPYMRVFICRSLYACLQFMSVLICVQPHLRRGYQPERCPGAHINQVQVQVDLRDGSAGDDFHHMWLQAAVPR